MCDYMKTSCNAAKAKNYFKLLRQNLILFLLDSPTKSLMGPTSIEFQLNDTYDGQFV